MISFQNILCYVIYSWHLCCFSAVLVQLCYYIFLGSEEECYRKLEIEECSVDDDSETTELDSQDELIDKVIKAKEMEKKEILNQINDEEEQVRAKKKRTRKRKSVQFEVRMYLIIKLSTQGVASFAIKWEICSL